MDRRACGRRPGGVVPGRLTDLARQVGLLLGAYAVYRLTRGAADDATGTARAFANARAIIDLERGLGLFVEPAVQRLTSRAGLQDALAWAYVNTQTTVTAGALGWLWLRHRAAYARARDVLLASFALACAGYLALPTAPPRFLPEWGFTDPVRALEALGVLFNPYAAVPSVHVVFALVVGVPLARLTRHRAVRLAWAAYPVLVTLVIIATANHFVLDAALGALTVAVAAAATRALPRTVPAPA